MTHTETQIEAEAREVLAAATALKDGRLTPDEAIHTLTSQQYLRLLGVLACFSDHEECAIIHGALVRSLDRNPDRRQYVEAALPAEAQARGMSLPECREYLIGG